MKLGLRLNTLRIIGALCILSSTLAVLAAPRPPEPPWPQSTLKIYGWDAEYWKVPWDSYAVNEELATVAESWSGYSLVREGMMTPVVVPVLESEKKYNVAVGRGSIRFWFAPNWSSVGPQHAGNGPGHLARLIELVNFDGKSPQVQWSLYLDESGNTIYLTGIGKSGAMDILKAPVSFEAGDWRMISLCYSTTNTTLSLDGELLANGDGLPALSPEVEKTAGLVVGSDAVGTIESAAEGQFEELTTFSHWFKRSDWQELYFQATKQRTLFGPKGSKEAELLKIEILKEAGILPEDYGTYQKNGPEGDGPMEAYSYGSNTLWLEIISATNGIANLIVHGTLEDEAYEILSKDDLTNALWAGEQVVIGAVGQDWTSTTIEIGTRTNSLFFWARSLMDTDGDGLPDWWEFANTLDPNNSDTGDTGLSDGEKDGDNDGWTNLQEYQNGTNPDQFNTPHAPHPASAWIDQSGSNVVISWGAAGGPVKEYVVERYGQEIARLAATNRSFINYGGAPTNYAFLLYYSLYGVCTNDEPTESAWFNLVGQGLNVEGLNLNVELFIGAQRQPYALLRYMPPDLQTILFYDLDNQYNYSSLRFSLAATNFQNGIAPLPLGAPTNEWGGVVIFVYESGKRSAGQYVGLSFEFDAFVDASAYLKANLHFKLRAASAIGGYGAIADNGYQLLYPGPTNYEYADIQSYYQELRPHIHNYIFKNFVLEAPWNSFNTGAYVGWWPYFDAVLPIFGDVALYDPLYSWAGPLVNIPANPPLSYTNEPMWIFFDDLSLNSDRAASVGISIATNGNVSLASNARNLYGLPITSALFLNNGSSTTLAAGGTVNPGGIGQSFFKTQSPNLQTTGYYFTRGDLFSKWQPGNYDFETTNTSETLISAVGQRIGPTGFAKQSIQNGYTNVYAYLGQYFDKAFKMATNGSITTNQIGILSEYGVYFATEPGGVALVTKPDIETGQRGTAVVHVARIQLDVNHDGVMDMNFGGPDTAVQEHPFRFWINSDCDEPASDGKPDRDLENTTRPDSTFANLRCTRNLEDFARLWIVGLPDLPPAEGYSVTLSMDPNITSPTIGLYAAQDAQGGIGYLTNTTAATNQFEKQFLGSQLMFDYAKRLTLLSAGATYELPLASTGQLLYNGHYLFEGVKAGKGSMSLTVWKNGEAIFTTSAYLELSDVREMYEHASVTNVLQRWPLMVEQLPTSGFKVQSSPDKIAGETEELALFIHGWRMTETNYFTFSDTMFKRLYWQGFQGRFAALRWPTRSKDTEPFPGLDFATFNRSEHIALKSGTGTAAYLNDLRGRFPDHTISLCAHSMGGTVTMQAMKELAAANQQPLDNVVLMQAAVPAHCYDQAVTNLPSLTATEQLVPTPNTYFNYAAGTTNCLRGDGRIVNLFNPDDFALAAGVGGSGFGSWEFNQKFYFDITNGPVTMKPNTLFGYYTDGTNSLVQTNYWNKQLLAILYGGFYLGHPTRTVTNVQELMPFVARPRSKAVGAQAGVGGMVTTAGEVDLKSTLNFTRETYDHSGQFNRNIQEAQIWPFYTSLRLRLFPAQ